jgi:hypothetical protein
VATTTTTTAIATAAAATTAPAAATPTITITATPPTRESTIASRHSGDVLVDIGQVRRVQQWNAASVVRRGGLVVVVLGV